jgi:polysaccharide export outer membrane protein
MIRLQFEWHLAIWPLIILIAGICLSCKSGPQLKEGKIDDLLSPKQDIEVPLETESMLVETIATELEPQVDEYRIGPNDILNIVVLEHPEVSSLRDYNMGIVGTMVKKDGFIYLPIVGKIKAAGHTVEEFHEVLREKMKQYVINPQLSVDVLKYASKKFYVLGMVNTPGAFPVDGKTTLLEGIGLAGGIMPDGSLEGAYVVRENALLPIDFADLLLRGDTRRNIYMKDRDLVYVPSSENQRVYVFGEVREPGAVQISHGRLSLAQALAESGGLLPIEADRGSIKLIRGSWQEPTIYTLTFNSILANGDRIYLKPGDRIVVQPTGLTTASRYMQQILPFLEAADKGTAIYDRLSR